MRDLRQDLDRFKQQVKKDRIDDKLFVKEEDFNE